MNIIITRITALIAAISVWFGAVFSQTPIEGVFPDESAPKQKIAFDEGEFVMGDSDIIVSPDGDDSNDGTVTFAVAH